MADAARREAWQHTAWLAALIANANRDRKKHPRPFTPDEFNPMATTDKKTAAVQVTAGNMDELKQAFVGNKGMGRRSYEVSHPGSE